MNNVLENQNLNWQEQGVVGSMTDGVAVVAGLDNVLSGKMLQFADVLTAANYWVRWVITFQLELTLVQVTKVFLLTLCWAFCMYLLYTSNLGVLVREYTAEQVDRLKTWWHQYEEDWTFIQYLFLLGILYLFVASMLVVVFWQLTESLVYVGLVVTLLFALPFTCFYLNSLSLWFIMLHFGHNYYQDVLSLNARLYVVLHRLLLNVLACGTMEFSAVVANLSIGVLLVGGVGDSDSLLPYDLLSVYNDRPTVRRTLNGATIVRDYSGLVTTPYSLRQWNLMTFTEKLSATKCASSGGMRVYGKILDALELLETDQEAFLQLFNEERYEILKHFRNDSLTNQRGRDYVDAKLTELRKTSMWGRILILKNAQLDSTIHNFGPLLNTMVKASIKHPFQMAMIPPNSNHPLVRYGDFVLLDYPKGVDPNDVICKWFKPGHFSGTLVHGCELKDQSVSGRGSVVDILGSTQGKSFKGNSYFVLTQNVPMWLRWAVEASIEAAKKHASVPLEDIAALEAVKLRFVRNWCDPDCVIQWGHLCHPTPWLKTQREEFGEDVGAVFRGFRLAFNLRHDVMFNLSDKLQFSGNELNQVAKVMKQSTVAQHTAFHNKVYSYFLVNYPQLRQSTGVVPAGLHAVMKGARFLGR